MEFGIYLDDIAGDLSNALTLDGVQNEFNTLELYPFQK